MLTTVHTPIVVAMSKVDHKTGETKKIHSALYTILNIWELLISQTCR